MNSLVPSLQNQDISNPIVEKKTSLLSAEQFPQLAKILPEIIQVLA